MVFTASAASVAVFARASGGYGVGSWAPAGITLLVGVAVLLALGLRPGLWVSVAAVAFVALGLWALTSTQWGGIPNEAWRLLDQSLIAGAAVVLGCLVGSVRRRSALTYGVLAGITVNAGEILLRPLAGAPPEGWIYGRTVDGTVGYHNAQANICAIGICLAVAGMGRARRDHAEELPAQRSACFWAPCS